MRIDAVSSKEQVKASFSQRATNWAACYADAEHHSVEALNLTARQQFALEMVEAALPRGAKILDAGCGPGEMVAKLMERGYDVWGIDIAEPMIRHARDRCRSDQFRVGDLEQIPFPDNMFDAVVCLGVIEYLQADVEALREIRRVLRPGGVAVIATPNAICPLQNIDRVLFGGMAIVRPLYYFLKYRLRGRPAPRHEPPGIVHRRYSPRKWLRLLRSLALNPEEWICHSWGWYSSPLGLLVQVLSRNAKLVRRNVERLFGPAFLRRATDRFVRSPAFNWLASEHIVRVRALK